MYRRTLSFNHQNERALFQVADTWDTLDGWMDAVRLVYTIYARGKSDILAGVITG